MADPIPYSPGYDFSDFQEVNPRTPLPADEVDTELANIAYVISQLRAGLMNIRRSDGKLKNGIVTLDSLSQQVKDRTSSIGEVVEFRDAAQEAAASAAQSLAQITALLEAADLGDGAVPTIYEFDGDGEETEFDLGEADIDEKTTHVHISGVYQQKTTYSIVGTKLVFDEAPPIGVKNIEVAIFGAVAVAYATATLPDGSVPIEILPLLPDSGNFNGRMVYLTTEGVLYVYKVNGWYPVGTGDLSTLPEGTTLIEIAATLPVIGNYQGRAVYLTTQDRLYLYDGAQWAEISGSGGLPSGTIGIEIVNALPDNDNFEGRVAYLTTDDKIYSYDGSGWHPLVDISDVNFPEGFTGIQIVTVLPDTGNFEGRTVYLTTDDKLHVWDGSMWLDVGAGTGGDPGGLPDGTVGVEIVDELPSTDNFEGRIVYLTTDGKLYTYTDGAWKTIIEGTDVNFPDGFTGVQITSTLPASDNFEGRIVYLETDGKLYRYTNDAWTKAIDAEDILGQITSTQIADSGITTPKLAAGVITADKLAVNSVTTNAILAGAINAAKIAASAITSDKIAANAVTANAILAGSITAAKMSVANLAAISATLGSVNIQNAILGTLEVGTINLAGNAVTVQAEAETAGALSISGSGFNLAQSVSITWGEASLWVFCQFRCTTNEEVELDIRNGGTSILASPITMRAPADAINVVVEMFPQGAVSGSGNIGFWLKKTSAGTITIRNRKIGILAAKR